MNIHSTQPTAPDQRPAPMSAAPMSAAQAAQLIALLEAAQVTTAAPAAAALVPGEPITVRDLVAKAQRKLANTSSRRAYGPYLSVLTDGVPTSVLPGRAYDGIADKLWHEVLTSDLEIALGHVKNRALAHGQARDAARAAAKRALRKSNASGAVFNAVGAWRFLGQVAIADRHLAPGYCPAQQLTKPKRRKGGRDALDPGLLETALQFVASTGDDPELDELIVHTILVSGARQEGILNLSLSDLDRQECAVRLDEKFGKVVHQPVPDWFMDRLIAFAVSRGAVHPGDKVFVKRPIGRRRGAAISPRRFNYLASRIQASFDWADKLQVTAHTFRHEAIKAVERTAGKAVSVAFARHEPEDTNDMYSKASRQEVAAAVVRLYGGDHPWLHRSPRLPG